MHLKKSGTLGLHNWNWWWQIPWWEWKVDFYATSKVATCISVVYIIDARVRRRINILTFLVWNIKQYQHWNCPIPVSLVQALLMVKNISMIEVQGCMIRSSFIVWTVVHQEVTNKPRLRTKSGSCLPEHYRYCPCQYGTALFTKHQGISQISVSPCCRDTHL